MTEARPAIQVTQDHINNGGIGCHECPIALAMIEQGYTEVEVGKYEACYVEDGKRRHGRLPIKARNFISMFDRNFEVSPFRFQLIYEQEG